jgi:hypothetical protein
MSMSCRIITLDDERVQSQAWEDIRKNTSTDEEADNLYDELLKEDFINWYGQNWTLEGVEPLITDSGVQNIYGEVKPLNNQSFSLDGLNKRMLDYIQQSGINPIFVDKIKGAFGDSANAFINFTDKTLQLVEGKLKEDTLSEEASHVYTQIVKEQNPELYNAMYKQVINYPEYKEVKEQYADVYQTEEEFRFEAIGKVISNRIINKTKNTDTFVSVWWSNLKKFIKDFLNVNSEQFKDYFSLGADAILNSDGVYKIQSNEGKFYQLDTFNWNNVVQKIQENNERLDIRPVVNELGESRETYFDTLKNRFVKFRATEKARGNRKYSKVFNEEEKAANQLKADFGTKAHSAANNIIERYVATRSNKPVPAKSTAINPEMYSYLESYLNKILTLPEFEGAIFISEKALLDESRDLAGTLDWIILDKTGKAHILDFKFVTAEKGKKLIIKKDKIKEWNDQIAIYKSMLNKYGVNKFGMLRMLPIGVVYSNKTEALSLQIQGEDPFEKAVPSKEERTGDENLDTIINKLYKEAEALRGDKRILFANKEDRLRAIEKSINDLLLKKDLSVFKKYLKSELDKINEDLERDEITAERAKEMSEIADYYADIDLYLKLPELNELAQQAREIKKKFPEQLTKWATARNLNYKYFKPTTGFLTYLTSLSSISNPVFSYLNKLYQSVEDNKEKSIKNFIESIKDLKINADKLLEKKDGNYTGRLISRYSKDFFETLKKSDSTWIAKNVKVVENVTINGKEYNAKDYFYNEVARKRAYLSQILSPQAVEEEIDRFRRFNDFWDDKYKDKAISYYKGNSIYIKPTDKWFTNEYKEIVSNPDSDNAKFYNIIQDLLNDAKQYTTGNEVDIKFIPFIEKSLMKKVFDTNLNVDKIQSHFKDYYSIKDYDNTKGDREIRLKYLQQINPENQNLDLKEVYTLFAESVYNVKYMSEIEADAYLGGKLLETGKYIKLNTQGNPELDKNNQVIYEEFPNEATKKNYDSFVDSLIYNIRDKSDIDIAGMSGGKLINGALKYNSFLRIGFNVLSASANLIGGNANQVIEGFKGKFFTTKDLGTAKGLFWSRNSKAMALINYFDISNDSIVKKAREISESNLDKIFNLDWIMKMQEVGEKEVQYTTLLAYLEGMTIKDNKLVKKGKDEKSLLDLVEITDGKVVIPEFSDQSFNRVKLAVTEINTRLTGARTERNKMLYQNYGYLRLLTQFKTWVLPMGKERFGSLTYNSNLGMYEEGRFNSIFSTLINSHWKDSTAGLLKSLVTFNIKAASIGAEAALRERYNVMITINPNFNPQINPENGIEFEDYVKIYEENVKAMLGEALLLSTILLAGLKLVGDDDDKSGIKVKLLERFHNELTYFYNVQSYLDLGGISVPLLTTVNDFRKLINIILEDSWKIASGESETIDTAKLKTRVNKTIFGFRQYDNIMNLVNGEDYGKN